MDNITNFSHQLLNDLKKDQPLNGYQLSILKLAAGAYLKIAKAYNEDINGLRPITNNFRGSSKNLKWILLKSKLLQDYKQTYEIFYRNSNLRRVIKDQAKDPEAGIDQIIPVTEAILNKDEVLKLREFTLSYLYQEDKVTQKSLADKVNSTAFVQKVRLQKSIKEFYKFKSFGISLADGFANTTGRITGGISAGFGAIVGPIEWREGRLHKNDTAREELLKKLKPLDLLLEKKSFKLTDYTIPGHWGHIGVWLGNEDQLREIGMWEHPIIKPFQEKIKEGYSIYEVRRWGLVWDKLDNWMNLDALAVIRHKQVGNYKEVEYSKVFSELFSQIGKKYDYSFDAMTAATITCTEIISLSYGPIKWPTTKVVGRHTLQPDNIAALTLFKDSPIDLVAYLKGTKLGHSFKSKDDFSSLIGFRPIKNKDGQYEEEFRKCKRERYRSNRRGGI